MKEIEFDEIFDYPEIDQLEKAVQELLEKYADQENRLRNMANQLEEHLSTPDAHNPGMIYKK